MGEAIGGRVTSQREWKEAGLLLILTLAVFWHGIDGKFVSWDDEPLIYANPNIALPTSNSLAWHWRHPHVYLYIPVVYTAWWCIAKIDLAIGGPEEGLNPAAFHLANLLVHLASVAVVFWLLRRIVGRGWAAVAGAAIFAVHPLQVEPVAWATGMKDVLGGFLSLAAIALYLAAGERKAWNWRWWAATAVFVAALLAKPSAVMAPAIVFVLDWLVFRRSVRDVMRRLWPWVVLAVVWAAVTKWVQPGVDIDAGRWWVRPWVAADAIGFYLWKLVWPVHLGIDYGRTPPWVIGGREIWGVATTIVVAIALCVARRAKLSAAALVFVLALVPVLGLVPFDFQSQSTVADRYVYVAMLGPAIALGLAVDAMPRRLAIELFIILIGVWSVFSFRQVGVWHDSFALFAHALEVNPKSLTASQDLAVAYDKSGQELEATTYYLRAIDVAPDDREAYDNLAMALPRAEKQLPGYASNWIYMHNLIADFYGAHGDLESARVQRTAAERLR